MDSRCKEWCATLGKAVANSVTIFSSPTFNCDALQKGYEALHAARDGMRSLLPIQKNTLIEDWAAAAGYILSTIEDEIKNLNDKPRLAVLRDCINAAHEVFAGYDNLNSIKLADVEGRWAIEMSDLLKGFYIDTLDAACTFVNGFGDMCYRYDICFSDLMKKAGIDIAVETEEYEEPEETKYLHRSVRCYILYCAMEKMLISAGIDTTGRRMKIIEFIETVTGGNPNAPGKNTHARRFIESAPTPEAAKLAEYYLSRLGL